VLIHYIGIIDITPAKGWEIGNNPTTLIKRIIGLYVKIYD
jgi:hypothetical protein